jgi:hypothetical protein
MEEVVFVVLVEGFSDLGAEGSDLVVLENAGERLRSGWEDVLSA